MPDTRKIRTILVTVVDDEDHMRAKVCVDGPINRQTWQLDLEDDDNVVATVGEAFNAQLRKVVNDLWNCVDSGR